MRLNATMIFDGVADNPEAISRVGTQPIQLVVFDFSDFQVGYDRSRLMANIFPSTASMEVERVTAENCPSTVGAASNR
jgi:hypothetical protein